MLLFAKISRFPLFENSGFLVETGSFPDGRGAGGGEHTSAPPATPPVSLQLWLYIYYNEVTIRPAAGRILTKPGMMTFLVCFMRRLIRVICLLTRVS